MSVHRKTRLQATHRLKCSRSRVEAEGSPINIPDVVPVRHCRPTVYRTLERVFTFSTTQKPARQRVPQPSPASLSPFIFPLTQLHLSLSWNRRQTHRQPECVSERDPTHLDLSQTLTQPPTLPPFRTCVVPCRAPFVFFPNRILQAVHSYLAAAAPPSSISHHSPPHRHTTKQHTYVEPAFDLCRSCSLTFLPSHVFLSLI